MVTSERRESRGSPGELDRADTRSVLVFARTLVRTPSTWIVLGLTLLSLLQRPGKVTFDTKLDLTADPAGFLLRALHLWNPQTNGGVLQNQAYGYLFPMGPYFVLCDALGMPVWIAQRLWCALLLSVAFGGMLLVARTLRIGTERTRLIGAAGYALAPRMLTEIGPLSSEMLPAVLLPWVLLPLIRVDRIGSARRAAGLSALAVLGMGGVNGSMVVMALVLPGLWLLSREWTREHRTLVAWWCAGVVAATLWWIIPLLVLGEYSLPFLDYIESSANTTAPMSLFQVLRGTNQWVAYVVQGSPWWPAGFVLIDNPMLMVATAMVAAIGLFGLARQGLPQRRFLVLAALTGLTLLTIGYVGTLDSPLSEQLRQLLNGPLAPLRNVHKFEPVLRLPLILGFVHAISAPKLPRLGRLPRSWPQAVAALLVVVVAAPAWTFMLRPGTGWDEIPRYWHDAMDWVAAADGRSSTLLLPATGFAEYTWGRTVDEPAQPLASSPWALRNQVPLGSEGHTRMMDAVTHALETGRGHPALADFLARSGIRFLLLRNDIDRDSLNVPPVSVLHASLAGSPGIERVAEFGPLVDPSTWAAPGSVDSAAAPVHALEIYRVRRDVPRVSAVHVADVATVSGGPESLLALLASGQLAPAAPTILTGDRGSPGDGPRFVTDGLRHRERNFGRVRDNLSQTMTAHAPSRQDRATLDVLPFPGTTHQTMVAYQGIRSVRASTSTSYADAVGEIDRSHQPFAAIDGDPATAWHSSTFTGPVGEWLEVRLQTPQRVESVRLNMVDKIRVGWAPTRIRITTDAGSTVHDVNLEPGAHTYATAPGLTTKVRVTVLALAAQRRDSNVGIAELRIPGVSAQRALRVPDDLPVGPAPGFSFSRGPAPRYACVSDPGVVRCDQSLARQGEEPGGIHRLLRLRSEGDYRVGGTVLPAMNGELPVSLPGLEVSASSRAAGDPAAGGFAAVDGNPATTWIPDATDTRPTLRLKWSGERELTEIEVSTDPGSAPRPTKLVLSTDTERRTVRLDETGHATFEPLSADSLSIRIAGLGPLGLASIHEPGNRPGITSVRLPGLDDLLGGLEPETPFRVSCGSGPTITVDGTAYRTAVRGTLGDIIRHRELPLEPCEYLAGGLELTAGEHVITGGQSESFVVQDLWLRPERAEDSSVRQRETTILGWKSNERAVAIGPGERAVLRVPENANEGWVATLGERTLQPTRVDGWQQAWIVPAGAGGVVRLEFTPDGTYRAGLLTGAFAALALLVVTLLPIRGFRRIGLEQSGSAAIPIALACLLGLLGGMLPVVLLIACLLLRYLWPRVMPWVAFAGMTVACAVAVTGRVLGHGQEWAYAAPSQAALLVAVAAVAAAATGLPRRPRTGRHAAE